MPPPWGRIEETPSILYPGGVERGGGQRHLLCGEGRYRLGDSGCELWLHEAASGTDEAVGMVRPDCGRVRRWGMGPGYLEDRGSGPPAGETQHELLASPGHGVAAQSRKPVTTSLQIGV